MSETFGGAIDRLADWLGVTGQTVRVSRTQLGDIVNLSRRELIKSTTLRFGETGSNYSLVAEQAGAALDPLFLRPFACRWTPAGGSPVPVKQKTFREFRAQYPLTETGKPASGSAPQGYLLYGGFVYVGPIPGGAGTLSFDCYSMVLDLSDEAAGDEFLDGAWDTLLWLSLVNSSKYIMQDPRASVWMQAYRESRALLLANHAASLSTDRVGALSEPG